MTVDEAIAAVAKVSMGKHRPPMSVRGEMTDGDSLRLRFTMGPLVNADTGEDDGTYINRVEHVSAQHLQMMSPVDLLRYFVAKGFKAMVVHEVEEHLRADGVRFFEPHAERSR